MTKKQMGGGILVMLACLVPICTEILVALGPEWMRPDNVGIGLGTLLSSTLLTSAGLLGGIIVLAPEMPK